ncbi:MAG: PolC-type DNA polymerase III, partial [Lachnospiraceae bacterium]|nr:PolC-type DNA polymerase III [Lachnospiraceae bacterium]
PSDSKPAAEPKKEAKKEPAANKSKDNVFKFKAKKLPPDPNLIFGKNFDGTPVSISAIQEEIGEAVVTGQAVSSEEKVIAKLNKVCFTFVITDFTDSIKVKLFVTPEAYEEFKTVYEDKKFYTVKGYVKYDEYDKELEISSVTGIKYAKDTRVKRFDDAPFKRVELHAHTKMSDMDAVTNPEDLVKTAFEWGHRAVAITDHGVVQGFTDANHALDKKKFKDDPEKLKRFEEFKIIWGCEGYIVDDVKDIAVGTKGLDTGAPAVAVSLITDGTDAKKNNIISFAAKKCDTGEFISSEESGIKELFDFISGSVICSIKPDSDIPFLKEAAMRNGADFSPSYLDLDGLARSLFPDIQSYKIGALAKEFKIKGEAKGCGPEAKCVAELHTIFMEELRKRGINALDELNGMGTMSDKAIKTLPYHHIILLCKNDIGRINLYRLVSLSHLKYFNKRPRIPKSLLMKYREGIIVGSACEAGELFRAVVFNKPEAEIERLCNFYDYYEVQPIGNNKFMIDDPDFNVSSDEDLRDLNRRIVELGEKHGKLVVATSDEHFLNPEDSIYRSIIMAAQGFKDADRQPPLYLHTTKEMLEEFSYLGEEKAFEIVVTNTNKVADMIEKISPVRPDKAPPVIKDSDKILTRICYDKAHSMYGEELPPIVKERLEHELNSIISNGFAVMYIIAQKLVWKSNEDGYLVGSRGSVGSSFVATMAGITEVNPLPPHYYCESCHYSDFDSDIVKEYQAKSGFDLPDAVCPVCGKKLIKDGNNIPFETFLGFNGDKEPDIDLNFSGEYQSKAHAYTEVIFGEGQTFRAGTVSGVADKTAYAYVYKYFEDYGVKKRRCELERLAKGCEGVKKTTGQHPGGIIVLPYGEDIYSFTPVQRPANDVNTTTVTTHFDYHSIDHNLLKLDILGHDDPTMIRMLQDLTGVSMKEIPMDDKNVVSLFSSPKALGLTPEDIEGCPTGSLGLPELGTDFVIQMLMDTKPECFSDMIRISGLSHGTNVWLNNTQDLIRDGKCTLATAVCTRDDIMIYLISKNIEPGTSFKIMESVRKGKGLTPEWEQLMLEHDVPDWYIWSCKQIKYMFPKAHACAYIMMAFRIAWFKIYKPLAYYAAYFSIRAKAMNYSTMCCGEEKMLEEMNRLKKRANSKDFKDKLSPREEDALKDMKIVLEMYRRGLDFTPIDIYKAKATRFQIVDDKLMPCLNSIDGLGENAAMQIEENAKKGKFLSIDDFKKRCKISTTVCDTMESLGLLGNMPKSNQISFEDLFKTN